MKKVVLLLVFVTVFQAMYAQKGAEAEVASVVEALRQAMIDGNQQALEKLSAEELSYGHSSGVIEDKKEFVGNIVSGKSDFVTIAITDQTIRVVGNTAIVRHKLAADTNNNGTPGKVNIGVLLVWQKIKGDWKLLARQAVRL